MTEQEAVVAEPTPETAEPAKPERTFSPEDVERIVKERLTRERSKYAEFDALKEKASKYDQLQAEQMSEVEKAQAAAKAEAERAAAIEAELLGMKKLTTQRSLLVDMGFDAVAVEKLAGRLSGDDEAAWKVDAENFLPYMKAGSPKPPSAANQLDTPPEDKEMSAFTAALNRSVGV